MKGLKRNPRIKPWMKLVSVIVSLNVLATPFGLAGNLPTGGAVTHGSVDVNVNGQVMTIDQATAQAIVNWESFNIGADYGVIVNQPDELAGMLSRVVGADPTEILGSLQANGRFLLVNPNGVYFGPDAVVDVNQLIASSLNIGDQDFLNGNLDFSGDSLAAVENMGTINAELAALIGRDVTNAGTINAAEAILAAASNVELGTIGGGMLSVDLSGLMGTAIVSGAIDASGDTGGDVVVAGGTVGIDSTATIDASGTAAGGTINIGGAFQGGDAITGSDLTVVMDGAQIAADAGTTGDGGNVVIWSDGDTNFQGSISATGGALAGDGGAVEVSGLGSLGFTGSVDTTAVNGEAGMLLLDPQNLTIINAGPGANDASLPTILDSDGSGDWVVSENALEALVGGGITLEATDHIIMQTLSHLDLSDNTSLTIRANHDSMATGIFTMDSGDTITVGGPITIYGGGSVQVGSLNSSGGGITLGVERASTGAITVNGAVNTNGGLFTLVSDAGTPAAAASSFNLAGTGSVTTGNGNFISDITGAHTFNGNVNAGSGAIVVDGNDAWGGTLTSGVSGSGTLTSTNSIWLEGTTVASTLNYAGAGTDLRVYSNAALTVNHTGGAADLLAWSAGGDLVVNNTGGLLTVNASGATASGGTLTFASDTGVLVSQDIAMSGTADLVVNAGTSAFTTGGGVDLGTAGSTADDISITAGDVVLGGTLRADNTISINTPGTETINLGVGSGGSLVLDNAELTNTYTPLLTIGDSTNGMISIEGVTGAATANIDGMVINGSAAGPPAVRLINASSTFALADGLVINATGDVNIGQDLTVTGGGLTVAADNDVTVNATVDVDEALDLSADDDTGGAGTLTIGSAANLFLTSGAAGVSLQGETIRVGADGQTVALNAGTGSLTVAVTGSGDLQFGPGLTAANTPSLFMNDALRPGSLEIDDTPGTSSYIDTDGLAITSMTGTVELETGGALALDDAVGFNANTLLNLLGASITAAGGANLQNTGDITANATGTTLTLQDVTSTSGGLDLDATTALSLQDLSAVNGGIAADAGTTISVHDATAGTGMTFTAPTSITLNSTYNNAAGDVTFAGPVILASDTTVNQNSTTNGDDVIFQNTITSPGTAYDLDINVVDNIQSDASFGGTVGTSGNRLDALTVDGNIITIGGATYATSMVFHGSTTADTLDINALLDSDTTIVIGAANVTDEIETVDVGANIISDDGITFAGTGTPAQVNISASPITIDGGTGSIDGGSIADLNVGTNTVNLLSDGGLDFNSITGSSTLALAPSTGGTDILIESSSLAPPGYVISAATLNGIADTFGTVNLGDGNSGDVTIANDGDVDLNARDWDFTITGDSISFQANSFIAPADATDQPTMTFSATSAGITDASGATVTVAYDAVLEAPQGQTITLGDNAGDTINFGTLQIADAAMGTGPNVDITEDSATTLAGVAAGTFSLTSDGDITQTSEIEATGATTLDAGTNNITLTDADNTMGDLTVTGATVSITEDSAITDGGDWTTTGLTMLNASGNNITVNQAGNVLGDLVLLGGGAATIAENDAITDGGAWNTGATTLTAGGSNDITLDVAGSTTGSLTLNGVNATVDRDAAIDIAGGTLTGALDLTSGGAITDSGSITVANGATLVTDDNDSAINMGSLDVEGGSFTITTDGIGDATIVNTEAVDFASATVGGALDATATTENITDTGAIAVTGNAHFTTSAAGADITLNNDFNAGSLTVTSTGDVVVSEGSATEFAGASTALSLDLDSTGAITDAAMGTVNVTNLADFAGSSIALQNAGHNFGSLTFVITNAADIRESSSTLLTGANSAASLYLESTADIADDDGVTSLNVTNLANFNGSSVVLDDTFNAGTLQFNSGGLVDIDEASPMALDNSSTAGTLVLNANGNMTQPGGNVVVTGTTSLTVPTTNDISLGSASNDFQGDVTVVSADNAYIQDANAIQLAGADVETTLDVLAGGAISDSGTITAPNMLFRSGGSVVLNDAGNDFNAIAGTSDGIVTIVDTDDLIVGNVTPSLGGPAIAGIDTEPGVVADGDTVTITTGGFLTVNDVINTENGTGGNLVIGGALINAAPVIGNGDVILNGAASMGDIVINVPLGPYTGDVTLTTNNGGVWVTSSGSINTSGDITMTGDAWADTYLGFTAPGGTGVTLEGALAANDISLTSTGGTDVIIDDTVTAGGTLGDVTINSADDVDVAAAVSATGYINIDAVGDVESTAGGTMAARANHGVSGQAIKITTVAGDITIGDTLTALDPGSPGTELNIAIDPVDVDINADVTATGAISVVATNDIAVANGILVEADTDDDGGALSITADQGGSGAGDLSAGTTSSLQGESVVLSGVNVTISGGVDGGTDAVLSKDGGIDIDANTGDGGSVLFNGAGDIASTGGGINIFADDDVTQSSTGDIVSTGGSVEIDANGDVAQTGTTALIDSDDDVLIGQTNTPTTVTLSPTTSGGITADDLITIDATGAILIEEDAVVQTTDGAQTGTIDIASSGGSVTLQGAAQIFANEDDTTANLIVSGDSVTLNSNNGTEIQVGGNADIDANDGDVTIGTGGSIPTDLDVDGNLNIDANDGGGGSADVVQDDGTMRVGGNVEIGMAGNTVNITQGSNAGNDAITDAIQAGGTAELQATNNIDLGSDGTDDALEAQGTGVGTGGAYGVWLNAGNDLILSGDGDIESSADGGGIQGIAGNDILLTGAGGMTATGTGDADVVLNAGNAVDVDQGNTGAFLNATDDVFIGQDATNLPTGHPGTAPNAVASVDISGDVTAGDLIYIDATGSVTVDENAIVQTTNDAATGIIDIDVTGGPLTVTGTSAIWANPDTSSADLVLWADSMDLRSDRDGLAGPTGSLRDDAEMQAGGWAQLYADNGSITVGAGPVPTDVVSDQWLVVYADNAANTADVIQVEDSGAMFQSVSESVNVRADQDVRIDPAEAQTFVDIAAGDDVVIDGDVIAHENYIYIRGDYDADGDGDVNITGTNTRIAALGETSNTNAVVWILGDNVTIDAIGSDPENDAGGGILARGRDVDGDIIPYREFAIAVLAQEDISYDAELLATQGSIFMYADAPVGGGDAPINGLYNTANSHYQAAPAAIPPVPTSVEYHIGLDGADADGSGAIATPGNGILAARGLLSDVVMNAPTPITIGPAGGTSATSIEAGRSVLVYSGEGISIADGSYVSALHGHVILHADSQYDYTRDYTPWLNQYGTPRAFIGESAGDGDFTMAEDSSIVANLSSPIEGWVKIYGVNATVDNVQAFGQDGAGTTKGITITASDRGTDPTDLSIDILGDLDSNYPGADILLDIVDTGDDTYADITQASGAQWTSAGTILFDDTTTGADERLHTVSFAGDVATAEGVSITVFDDGTSDSGIFMDGIGTLTIGGDYTLDATDDGLGTITQTSGEVITNVGNVDYAAGNISLTAGGTEANDGWILMTATDTFLTANDLTADTNSGAGFAVKLDAPTVITAAGDIVTDGTTGTPLNVSIDPTSVALNGDVDISGTLTVWANDDITIDEGRSIRAGQAIGLAANDDGTGGVDTAADNDGEVLMGLGSALNAGTIVSVTGESNLIRDVEAAQTVTITSDRDGGANSALSLGGAIIGPDGVTFSAAPITLVDDSRVEATDATSTGIAMNTTVDGDYTLALDAGGNAITLGTVGGTTEVESLTANTTGAITLNGDIAAEQDVAIGMGNIAIAADRSITSNDGDVDLLGAVDDTVAGTSALTVSGDSVRLGPVGTTTNVGSLGVTSETGTILTGDVTTSTAAMGTGAISILGGPIVIDQTTTLTSAATGVTLADIDGNGAGAAETLQVTAQNSGAITVADIGQSDPLGTVELVTAGQANLGGDITAGTVDVDQLTGGVVLTDDVAIQATNTAVNFQTTIDATTAGVEGLAIETGTGAITLQRVGGTAMGTAALDDLTIVNRGGVSLAGDLATVNDIDLSEATGGITVTADRSIVSSAGTVDLTGSTVTRTAAADDLVLGGAGTAGVAVADLGTAAAPFASIQITGAANTLSGDIYTDDDDAGASGAVTINGLSTLAADVTINSNALTTGGGAVDLEDLQGPFTLTVDSGDGQIDLDGAAIDSLAIGPAGVVNFDGIFTTTDAIAVGTGAGTVTGAIAVTGNGELRAGTTLGLQTSSTVDIDGDVTGDAGVAVTATQGVAIDADVSAAGSGMVDIATTNGNVAIAQSDAATLSTADGEVEVSASNSSVLLGSAGNNGRIVTTTGDVDIDALTAFTMAGTDTQVVSGGGIDIDPVTVTIAGAGLQAVNDITVSASQQIDVNATVESIIGTIALTAANNAPGTSSTVNLAADLNAESVAVAATDTDGNDSGTINVTSAIANTEGSLALSSTTLIDVDGSVTALGDVAMASTTSDIGAGVASNGVGDVTVTGNARISDDVVVSTVDGDVTFVDDVYDDGTANALTVNSDGTVTIASLGVTGADLAALTITGEDVVLTNDGAGGGTVSEVDGDVSITSDGHVQVQNNGLNLNTDGATGGSFRVEASERVTTSGPLTTSAAAGNAEIDITSDGLITISAAVDSQNDTVTLLSTDGDVTVNDTVDAGAGVTLETAAIDSVITITDHVTADTGAVTIDSGWDISQTAGQILADDGGVDIDAGNDVDLVDVKADANLAGNAIKITADGDVSITGAGLDATEVTDLNISIDPWNVTVGAPVAATGDVTVVADNNILVSAQITADQDNDDAGDLTITADSDGSGAGDARVTATLLGENIAVTGYDVALATLTADVDGVGDGDVTVTAQNNAAFSGAITAGDASGDVDLEATEGTLTTAAAADIAAGGNVEIDAGTAIDLDGDVGNGTTAIGGTIEIGEDIAPALTTTTDGVVVADGHVFIEGGDVTVNAAVESNDDEIDIEAARTVTTTDTLTADNNTNGDVTVTSGSDTTLGAAVSAGEAITVTAGGQLLVNGTLDADENVVLTADENVESTAVITADVDTDNAGSVTIAADADGDSDGNVDTAELVIGETVTVSGYNAAVDAVTARNGAAAGGTAIDVDAADSIDVGGTLQVLAGAADIDLTAAAGSVAQAATFDMLTAGTVDIDAGAGIDLDGTVGSGTAIGTAVEMDAGADIDLAGTVDADGNVTLTAGSNILASAQITADDDNDDTGDLTITADSDGSGAGDARVTATLLGENIAVTGYDVALATLTADVDGVGDGDVTVTAQNNAAFSGAITAGDASGDVDLEATDGNLVTQTGADIDAGGNVTVFAGDTVEIHDNIGDTTEIGDFVSITSNDEDVLVDADILADQDVTIDAGLDIEISSEVTIESDSESVDMDAGRSILAGDDVTILGNVDVDLTALHEDIEFGDEGNLTAFLGDVTMESGDDTVFGREAAIWAFDDVAMSAGGDVEFGEMGNITADGSDVTIDADGDVTFDDELLLIADDDVDIDAGGDVQVGFGGNITARDEDVEIDADGNITVFSIQGNATVIQAEANVLINTDDDRLGTGTDVVLGNSTLVYADGENVEIYAGRDILVGEMGNITADQGHVTMSAGRTIQGDANVEIQAYGNVTLETDYDDILIGGSGNITAHEDGNVTLDAGRDVYLASETDVTGNMNVFVGSGRDIEFGESVEIEAIGRNVGMDAGRDIILGEGVDIIGNQTVELEAVEDILFGVYAEAVGTEDNVEVTAGGEVVMDRDASIYAMDTADIEGASVVLETVVVGDDHEAIRADTYTGNEAGGAQENTGGVIQVEATRGSITVNGQDDTDLTAYNTGMDSDDADLWADEVNLGAVDGIGVNPVPDGTTAKVDVYGAERIDADTSGDNGGIGIESLNEAGNDVVFDIHTIGEDADIDLVHSDGNTTVADQLLTLDSVTTDNGDVNLWTDAELQVDLVEALDDDAVSGIVDDAHSADLRTTSDGGNITVGSLGGGGGNLTVDYDATLVTIGDGNITIHEDAVYAGNDVYGENEQAGEIGLYANAIEAEEDVTLISREERIIDLGDDDRTNITSGGDTALWVGYMIGQVKPSDGGPDPLEVEVGGALEVGGYADSPNFTHDVGNIWAYLNGTSGDGSIEYIGENDTPPGIIEWNGQLWGAGGESGFYFVDTGESFIGEMTLDATIRYLERYAGRVNMFEFLYFPHVRALLNSTHPAGVEHILDGRGTVEGLPAGVGPGLLDINALDDSFSYVDDEDEQ